MTPAFGEARLLIPDIQVEFEAKLNHAKDKLATVPRHQTGVATVVLSATDELGGDTVVDLSDLTSRDTWCSCGACHVGLHPCSHVLFCVAADKLLNGNYDQLYPAAVKAGVETTVAAALPLRLPATRNIAVDPALVDVSAPAWFKGRGTEPASDDDDDDDAPVSHCLTAPPHPSLLFLASPRARSRSRRRRRRRRSPWRRRASGSRAVAPRSTAS